MKIQIKNIPNMLCIIRIILIPFIVFFLIDNNITNSMTMLSRVLISGIIFGVAMLTDTLDGKIARKYNCISNFGKFIDPIADKLLVISVLIAYVQCGLINLWPVIIILAREFIVTGFRLMAAGHGNVVAANIWGKIKTFSQGVSIGVIYIYMLGLAAVGKLVSFSSVSFNGFTVLPEILIWLVAVFTAISAIPYYKGCKKYLKD